MNAFMIHSRRVDVATMTILHFFLQRTLSCDTFMNSGQLFGNDSLTYRFSMSGVGELPIIYECRRLQTFKSKRTNEK